MTTASRPRPAPARGQVGLPARLLAGALAPVTAAVLPAFLAGALAVQLQADLHFGDAGLGLAVGAFFACGALTSAGLGRVSERLGASAALRTAARLSGAVMLAVAGLARSVTSLAALLAIGGVANALAQPAANLFLARTVPPERQGVAFAVKQCAIPVATLLGGVAVPALALTVGWRWAFVTGAVLAAAASLVVPPAPVMGAGAADRASAADRGGVRPGAAGGRRREGDAPLGPLVVLSAGVGLGAAAAGTLGAFLVAAGVATGLSPGLAGLTLTMGSAVGIGARLLAGVRADRRGQHHLPVVAAMLALGTVAYVLLATGVTGLYLLATPLAFAAGWGWPGLFNLAVVRANPAAPAAATGITQTGTYVGAVIGPLAFGVVAERSYSAAWLLAGAASLLAAGAVTAGRVLLVRSRSTARPG